MSIYIFEFKKQKSNESAVPWYFYMNEFAKAILDFKNLITIVNKIKREILNLSRSLAQNLTFD